MVSWISLETSLLQKDGLYFCVSLKKMRDKRLDKIAQTYAKALEREQRQEIAVAQTNPKLLAARKFLKKTHTITPQIKECRKQLLAFKLGIKATAFDQNLGFQKFVSETYLERYLMEYKHSLSIEPHSQKLSLLVNGALTPWEEAKQIIRTFQPSTKTPKLTWIYGQNGLQNEDMYEWTELKPFKKDDPAKWEHRYIFEFCACCSSSPQKTGDHSWIRLKTPTGDVYSVGLYRPGKRSWHDNFNFPFRVKKGYLMQPDVSEFWPCDIYTIPVAITEDQFLKMKQTIENDKRNNDLTFQLFQSNCVLYTKKIAAIAGIEISTHASVPRLLIPKRFEHIVDSITRIIPLPIKKVCTVAIAFFVNVFQVMLGATMIDRQIKSKKRHSPHINSLKDLFNPQKMELHHPHNLAKGSHQWVHK